MIDVENLTKKFGGVTAVEALTFHVEEGEIFGLLGPNGAGKTTTVRMLSCLISKTSGEARVGGHEIGNGTDAMEVRRIVGLIPDNVGLYDALTAYQNLDFFGKLYDCPETKRKENIERFLRMLGLWERRDAAAGTFSKGMRQKLAIARALIHDPKVLLLDEPTANLDPEAAKTVRDFILELKREKRTILLNTHNLDEAQRICDRIGILKTRLVAVDTPRNLERSLWGRQTEVRLAQVTDAIVAAVKKLQPKSVTVESDRLVIELDDPDTETPAIVEAILAAGGRIQSVSELARSLEDAYLKLVRG